MILLIYYEIVIKEMFERVINFKLKKGKNMEIIITEAIKNKQLLKFTYNNKVRVVEPYTFGESTKGNDTLSAYQVDGGSNSSKDLGWRQFIIDDIEHLNLLDDKFEILREGYNPNDSRMSHIYITV